MTLESKIEICQKCTNRKMDWNRGMVCGLTGEKPVFDQFCPDFNADKKIVAQQEKKARKVWEQIDVLPGLRLLKGPVKIGKVWERKTPDNILEWSKYTGKYDVPDEFPIEANEFFMHTAGTLIAFAGLLWWALNWTPEQLWGKVLMWFFVFMVFNVFIHFLIAMIRVIREKKVYIQLDRNGIVFEDQEFVLWEDLETFELIKTRIRSRFSVYLVLAIKNEEKLYYDLSGLELSAEKLGHLIRIYSNQERTESDRDVLKLKEFQSLFDRVGAEKLEEPKQPQLKIRETNHKWFAVLMTVTGVVIPVYVFVELSRINAGFSENRLLQFLALIAPFVFFYKASKAWRASKNREVKIKLSESGITIGTQDEISWTAIDEMGYGYPTVNGRLDRHLVIYYEGTKWVHIPIAHLEYSPRKLARLILSYRRHV